MRRYSDLGNDKDVYKWTVKYYKTRRSYRTNKNVIRYLLRRKSELDLNSAEANKNYFIIPIKG